MKTFEELCKMLTSYGFHLNCYLMQEPVPGMSDEEAILDIQRAIDYLSGLAQKHGMKINRHLDPTYVASGTMLEESFRKGKYCPPRLKDVASAALHGQGKDITIFLGLSDDDLACEGGAFIRPGEEPMVEKLEAFNRSQNYGLLEELIAENENLIKGSLN